MKTTGAKPTTQLKSNSAQPAHQLVSEQSIPEGKPFDAICVKRDIGGVAKITNTFHQKRPNKAETTPCDGSVEVVAKESQADLEEGKDERWDTDLKLIRVRKKIGQAATMARAV